MYRYKHNEKYFENIDNSKKAYWLGFLYADGNITKRDYKRNWEGYNFELSLKNSDGLHVQTFAKEIDCDVPIKDKKVTLEKYGIFYSKRLMFFCKIFAENLIEKGCVPNKSLILKFPKYDIVEENLISHFIRGYFDGDGCVWYGYKPSNNQTACSVSFVGTFDFLKSMCEIFENFSNVNIPKIYQKGRNYQCFWYGFKNSWNIYKFIYRDADTYLDSKKIIFDKIFAHYERNFIIATDKNGEG